MCPRSPSESESEVTQLCLTATPWTVAHQAPPSMGFSRQEYWCGLPFPSPGDLPDPGIEPRSPALQADTLTSEPPGKPQGHQPACKWQSQSLNSGPSNSRTHICDVCSIQSPIKEVLHGSNRGLSYCLFPGPKGWLPQAKPASGPLMLASPVCLPGPGGGANCRRDMWDPGFGCDETPAPGAPPAGHGESRGRPWGVGVWGPTGRSSAALWPCRSPRHRSASLAASPSYRRCSA